MRLSGQQDRRHELIHALGGEAGVLGLEGGDLEADESSLKVITMITRRASVSVACTMDSQKYGSFLSSVTMLPPENQRLEMIVKWRGSRFERNNVEQRGTAGACWPSVVPRIALEWRMLLSTRAGGRSCDIWNGQRVHGP